MAVHRRTGPRLALGRSNSASPSAPLVDLVGLERMFGEGPRRVHALRSIDLQLRSGEVMVLLGPSGSGKSTLLNILGPDKALVG